ncbi:MAG: RHS repeat-associated core domain-containing protein [Terriglobales bacterium]
MNLSYGYALGTANNGQIQSITDNLDATKTLSYTYDALSRLQYATAGPTGSPTWKLGFVYDRYGNRTNENLLAGTGPSGMWTPDPTTNRLPAPYGYDAAGNMTNDSFNTYAFDAVNRIGQVTSNGATYSYDGNGLRVQRTSSGTTTTYVFSGTKVIAEYAGGALSKEYIYAGSQLLATVDASTGSTSYQHPDHLSTRVETSSTAGVTRTFGNFPFGEVWYETGTASKWKFTSYERDGESNLDYAMARHYSSVIGRFMSQDPLAGTPADPQTLNRYAYVRNDPIRNVDPLGLFIKNDPPEPEPVVEPTGVDPISILHVGGIYDDLFLCHGQVWCNGGLVDVKNTKGKINVQINVVPCSKDDSVLTINGNPLAPNALGGLSITLDSPAALFVGIMASQAAGANISFAPGSVVSLNPLPDNGSQVASNPPVSISLPGPNISLYSINFDAGGTATQVDARYKFGSGLVSRVIQDRLNAAGGGIGNAVNGILDALASRKESGYCLSVTITVAK